MKVKTSITIVAIVFIWIGMIIGISFLEAPLKFQAPGITLPLGLGIGKLVFGALTKCEMLFSFLLVILLQISENKKSLLLFCIPILIVIIDNALLMPILDARIDMILSGNTPPESSTHLWYVALEVVKLISLFYGGFLFINRRFTINNVEN